MNDITVEERKEQERKVSQKYKVTNSCKRLQIVANDRKRLQMVRKDRKWSQVVENGCE